LVAFTLWPQQPPADRGDFIAPARTAEKGATVEDQYMEALERANEEIEQQSDGG
jgi:hypothetical protein